MLLHERADITGVFPQRAIQALEAGLRGSLLFPGDSGYEEARRVWNGAFDRQPAMIVRCADDHDVVRAVDFARTYGLPLAVRSGGHSLAGHSSTDGGVLVDLSQMKSITIDPKQRTAWVQPGCTSNDLMTAALPYGLTLPTGDTGSVGIGGLALGGGIGFLARTYGLTVDHLLAAEVVTAGGQRITVRADHHPELFWALRGGGGNFGIVTAFQFRLQPVGVILGGAVFFPATAANLLAYARYAAAAPDELTTIAAVLPAPPAPFIPVEHHGTLALAVIICYAGDDLAEGERVVAPLRSLATPIADIVQPMPYPALYQITAEGEVLGRSHAVRSLFMRELDQELAETIVEQTRRLPTPMGMTQVRVLGGAMARVPADATAFAHRDQPFLLVLTGSWEAPEQASAVQAWVERYWEAVQQRASGVYVNFLENEGDARIRQAYPPATYARLADVKRAYDPANLFRTNQNIPPAE